MAKKGAREIVGMICQTCKNMNYVTQRNKVNMQVKDPNKTKLVINKFCKHCRKSTSHKETTKLK